MLGRLLKRARRLEASAWSEIYDQFYPRVYAMLLTRVHDSMLAEDLAADVFVNAMRAIHTYEDRGIGLAAWLFRIAQNRLTDHYRRTRIPMDELTEMASADEAQMLPIDLDVQQALERLNPEQRQIIHLRFIEGLTSQQVGQVMGKTEAAIKIAQHRALKRLKQMLNKRT